MKRFYDILSFLTLVACVFLSSCKKDQVPEPAKFNFRFSSFEIANGDYLTITPSVNIAESCSGLEILSISYYWDDKLVATKSSSPFDLKYLIDGQSLGNHVVKISVTYGGDGYLEMRTKDGFTFDVKVVKHGVVATKPTFIPGKEIANGETFICQASLDEEKTTADVSIAKVRFSWDDDLLAEISEAPFVLQHVFSDETVGEHTLTIRYFITGEFEEDRAFDYKIRIKE